MMNTDSSRKFDDNGIDYFPFFFSMVRTIERLEQKHLSVSHFLRGVAEYAAKFKPYALGFQNPNPIPEIFSEDEIDLFIGIQQSIDPRLNSYARRVDINREVGKLGGRPRGSSKNPKNPMGFQKPNGTQKTQWVFQNPDEPKKPSGFSKTQRNPKNQMG